MLPGEARRGAHRAPAFPKPNLFQWARPKSASAKDAPPQGRGLPLPWEGNRCGAEGAFVILVGVVVVCVIVFQSSFNRFSAPFGGVNTIV